MGTEAWREWCEVGDSRLCEFLDTTTIPGWPVECRCGRAEIRRDWLVEQIAAVRTWAVLPAAPE